MERRRNISASLALALGSGLWIVGSSAAMADEPVQQPAPTAQTQQTSPGLQSPQAFSQAGQTQQCTPAQQPPARVRLTGSNILRPVPDCSLPLLMLDRGYIDQSGAMDSTQLLRSVPQVQFSR